VHHSSSPDAGVAGQVPFLAQIFGQNFAQMPIIHPMAQSARNWGFGALFCGFAAPIALIMGLRANAEIRESPGRYSNGSDAIVAIAIGAISLILMIVGIVGAAVGMAEPHPRHTHRGTASAITR